ncbi:MAG: hypothetical protein ACLVJZ_10170 [[Clostridium] leptum]
MTRTPMDVDRDRLWQVQNTRHGSPSGKVVMTVCRGEIVTRRLSRQVEEKR